MSRYFLGKDAGAVIRDKLVFGGDETKADGLITQYLAGHSGWTAPEVTQVVFDAAVVVPDPAPSRTKAIEAFLTGPSATSKVLRALCFILLDELNLLRERERDHAADIAAAASLANLQTRWAARAAMPDRTVNQLKTAIQNKINAGSAD